MHRPGSICLLVAASTVALLGTADTAKSATPAQPSDFNGDGFADLAIGVYADQPVPAVNVIYGSVVGLTEVGDQLWTRATPGVQGGHEWGSGWGRALATADFDGDGYADLAISGTSTPAAGVNVLYGSGRGLTAEEDDLWIPATLHIEYVALGDMLAAGDFDGDGFGDLVIGGSVAYQPSLALGVVTLLHGSSTGLTSSGAKMLSRNSAGIQGLPTEDDWFGRVFAVGDLDADGYDDLAIGVPGPAGDCVNVRGSVNVLYGSPAGLSGLGSQMWTQDTPGVLDASEAKDACELTWSEQFGFALSIGDFDDDGWDDLAVGVPGEMTPLGGAVNVLYGSRYGLTANGDQFWNQDVPGIPGVGEKFDGFGSQLAAGDLDGDGDDDLAIGAPNEVIGPIGSGVGAHGTAHLLYGGGYGLTAQGSQVWSQNTPGVPGSAEPGDGFGSALAIADYGRTRQDDLVVGISSEGIGAISAAGAVAAIYGGSTGLSTTGVQSWHQNTTGILGTSGVGDSLGSALTP